MMMCIGSVSDFEVQMMASVERYSKWRSAEDLERAERSDTWLRARQSADLGWGLGLCLRRMEPARPYYHGRHFIPAWLVEDREFYVTSEASTVNGDLVAIAWHRDLGKVRPDADSSVLTRRK